MKGKYVQTFEEQVGVWRSGVSTGASWARETCTKLPSKWIWCGGEKAQSCLWGHCSPKCAVGSESGLDSLPGPVVSTRDCVSILVGIVTSATRLPGSSGDWHILFCPPSHSAGRLLALHFHQRAEIGTHLHLIALGQCSNINQGDRGTSVKELQCLIHTCSMELFRQVTPVNYQIFNVTDKSNNVLSGGSAGV